MPTLSSFEVESGKVWGYYSSSTRYILDTFERPATSGTLGISTNGEPWTTLYGGWYVNSSYQAEVDTGVSSPPYPLATYDLVDKNQLGYVNLPPGSIGMGIAFNVQDVNNWYAIVSNETQHAYSCNCSTCYNCNTCSYDCVSYTTNCSECGATCTDYCGGSTCCHATCNSCTKCTTGANCAACGTGSSYSCDCQTCYDYYYYLVILQSISGTVTTLNNITLSNEAGAYTVEINNGQVSYYAYSNTISGIISEPYGLGTVVYSGSFAISGTLGTQIGMIKSPATYGQGVTISGFFGTGL